MGCIKDLIQLLSNEFLELCWLLGCKSAGAEKQLFGQENQWGPPETFSREALLAELSQPGFLALVPSHILQLHRLLEEEFMPLDLCRKVDAILEDLEELAMPLSSACPVKDIDFKRYRLAIRQVSVLHMLKQLSNVYSTMKTEEVAALVPFFSFGEVESIIVDAVKNNYIKAGVD